jgi:hypothetical protein
MAHNCENCGAHDADNAVPAWDSCPTDRGEWRREYDAWFCDVCVEDVASYARMIDQQVKGEASCR